MNFGCQRRSRWFRRLTQSPSTLYVTVTRFLSSVIIHLKNGSFLHQEIKDTRDTICRFSSAKSRWGTNKFSDETQRFQSSVDCCLMNVESFIWLWHDWIIVVFLGLNKTLFTKEWKTSISCLISIRRCLSSAKNGSGTNQFFDETQRFQSSVDCRLIDIESFIWLWHGWITVGFQGLNTSLFAKERRTSISCLILTVSISFPEFPKHRRHVFSSIASFP